MVLAVETIGLSHQYAQGIEVLKKVNLRLPEGIFYGLLGPNGAGKSTLIGILSSLIASQAGQVTLFGWDLKNNRSSIKRLIGLMPQEVNFNPFETVERILLYQAGFYGVPASVARTRIMELLETLELKDKQHTPARALSGGMKRRLLLARALVHQPRLLILDEPTAGMDLELRKLVWQQLQHLNAQGMTIILTTHYLEEAEALCRSVGFLQAGELSRPFSHQEIAEQLSHRQYRLETRSICPEMVNLPEGCRWNRKGDYIAEIGISKVTSMNAIFASLDQAKVEVVALQPTEARLELFFQRIVDGIDTQVKNI